MLLPALQTRIERLDHLGGLGPRLAQKRQLIAPAQDMHRKQMLDLRKVAVELSAKLDQESVVGKLEQQFQRQIGWCLGGGFRQSGDRQDGLPG